MNYGWEIAKIIFYLILIVAIIYVLSYTLRKKIGVKNQSRYMQIVDRLYFDSKNSFIMLEAAEKIIILAQNEGNTEKIAEWKKNDFDLQNYSIQEKEKNRDFNFKTVLNKYLPKMKSDDSSRDDENV